MPAQQSEQGEAQGVGEGLEGGPVLCGIEYATAVFAVHGTSVGRRKHFPKEFLQNIFGKVGSRLSGLIRSRLPRPQHLHDVPAPVAVGAFEVPPPAAGGAGPTRAPWSRNSASSRPPRILRSRSSKSAALASANAYRSVSRSISTAASRRSAAWTWTSRSSRRKAGLAAVEAKPSSSPSPFPVTRNSRLSGRPSCTTSRPATSPSRSSLASSA
ncbi:hypothetical protein SCALM49S_00765 [Streptomyces californicus]